MRSSINCSAKPEHEAQPQPDPRHLVCGVRPQQHLTEPTVPNTATQENPALAEVTDLEDAFEALTEEMKFDWPEFSLVDRIKAGLIQSTLGLLLFLALIVALGFVHQSLIQQP
jgi:hypothetical protein